MALEADLLVDRRRLKRRLAIWQAIAVIAVVGGISVATRGPAGLGGGAHIARYRISGEIGDGTEQVTTLERLRKDDSIKAVLLHLDTPGGAVGGGEALHAAVKELAAAKPVVAVMDGTAASAGYMIAVAAPHIVARGSTLTGSIGVLMQTAEFSTLLQRLGVNADQLASGPLKGQPSPLAPLSPAGRSYLQALVADMYDQFVQKVADGRKMDPAKVRSLADGRAYSGRQALALGLVDELGGDTEALAWLKTERKLATGDLPVRDESDELPWQKQLSRAASDIVVGAITQVRPQASGVDGFYAIWQPSAAQ